MDPQVDGLLLLDKPEGPTSHDIVARVRACLGQRRVGHGGTLDPMASGLLPVVLGRATRLVRFLAHSPKHYRGTLQLGRTTDTDDVTGRIEQQASDLVPEARVVLATARKLEGRSLQHPPAFSARKVGGRRLYDLARRGESAQAPPLEVEIFRLELTSSDDREVFGFEAEVSSGTYIRAIARDLGRMLGCGGVLASLRRTRIGSMDVSDALTLPGDGRLDRRRTLAAVLELERMPLEPPALRLADASQARQFLQGTALRVDPDAVGHEGLIRVLAPAGTLLGMAERRDGLVRPRVVVAG